MKLIKVSAALVALAGASGVLFSYISPVLASVNDTPYPTNITLNGHTVSSPDHIVANDAGTSTSWIPIYYLQTALRQVGIQNTWDGYTWNLELPSGQTADLSNLPSSEARSNSSMAISINGTVVEYAPKIVTKDLSGTAQTSYAPIWYLQQVMTRMHIQYNWDGTNWTMTSSASTNTGGDSNSGAGGNTGTTNIETEQSMSTAMWNLFNATTFDVDQHPTMEQAGVTLDNPAGSVTASQVATWLADWAEKAKGITYMGTYYPYSLQYESSSDPYTWASQNGLFQGTGISSSSSQITPSQANTIIGNLRWWLNGYKESNGVYTMHVPFVSHYAEWNDFIQHGKVAEADYQSGMAQALSYFDRIQISGTSTLHVTLPNSSGTNVVLDSLVTRETMSMVLMNGVGIQVNQCTVE